MEGVSQVNKEKNFSQSKIIWIAASKLGIKTYGDRKEKAQISFQNKLFTRGPIFSKSNSEAATNFCQKYYAQNIVNLIVESEAYLTVWIEQKPDLTMHSQIERIKYGKETKNNHLSPLVACIDDSQTIQRQVKMTLESVGYLVMNILDPASSLLKLAKQKPDLILMDINMPKIDGYELCQRLRRSRKLKTVPVVMLTGREGLVDRVRAKFVGADEYLTKPFRPNLLIDVVDNLLESKSIKDDKTHSKSR